MTIILGCGAATIRGQILYEPQLLTGQIRYYNLKMKIQAIK